MTIRIDTFRNRLEATTGLIAIINDEATDLHVLATDRAAAADHQRVRGGDHDYALDTHGDPRARDLYNYLAALTIPTCELLTMAVHDAVRFLRQGDSPRPRTRRTITSTELQETLDAQARRRSRGEYTPLRRYPQTKP